MLGVIRKVTCLSFVHAEVATKIVRSLSYLSDTTQIKLQSHCILRMQNVFQLIYTGLVFMVVFSSRRVNTETSDNQWLSRGGRDPRDTHLPDSLWVSLSLRQCGHLSSQPPLSPTPLSVQGGKERMRGGDIKVWPEAEWNTSIFWTSVWKRYLLTVKQISLCASRNSYSVCIQNCISICKERCLWLVITVSHWMSQHVVYWSCCLSNNRGIPSESQCASLVAAISAPIPLLITSVNHLHAINYI